MSSNEVVFELRECEQSFFGILKLNRPEVANALSAKMIERMDQILNDLPQKLRFLVITGEGKNFCAGADLHWMKESAKLDQAANKKDAEKLVHMYEALYNVSVPTLAVVQGAAYGGAVGLAAACDYVIATRSARFCLSEVKVGLIPAVILPYVARKMNYGSLKRYSLTADRIGATQALECGLVQVVVPDEELDSFMQSEIDLLLAASPEAQRAFKKLQKDLREKGWPQGKVCAEAIANIRVCEEAQKGLKAFFNKQSPPWVKKGSWL
jgi:methylglutaconyl-CoA hydratase